MIELSEDERGVILSVKVQAGARKNAILGERNGALRIAVAAAPEKGKANRAVNEILSESFGVAKSAIELISGDTSSQKRFLIGGVRTEYVRARLASMLGEIS